ncbi:fidgetin [Gadus morhua]|uniref:Fidgetin n=1 Tax=Gadus morhua TaxID=8049 RepID=A0A8C5AQW7_GADMO|nr:fidgetin [Gadus morhua]
MITSSNLYGLKMQWTPEHSQWAEQHFDISSTTRSPAHKVEAYRGPFQRAYQYAWANDDISALTASNLLKKYAEKYSGILEGPAERGLLCSYSESVSGSRSDESWQEAMYPVTCAPDGVTVSKAGMTAAPPPTDECSPGGGGPPSEAGYSSAPCGGLPSQEYSAGYSGGSYLHYGGGSPPSPSPLPPPSALGPGYCAGSPLSAYSYPPVGYPQAPGPGYSPGGASAYLPSGIAAPTPLPPSSLPGYTYPSHNHSPVAPTPLSGGAASSLKRKAFYMSGPGDVDPGYGHCPFSQQRCAQSPLFRTADSSASASARPGGFERGAEASSLAFKPSKQPIGAEQQREFPLPSGRGSSPPYGATEGPAGELTPEESYGKFGAAALSEQSEERRPPPSHASRHAAAEQLKCSDAGLVAVVTSEVLQQGPGVDWGDVAGLDTAKAAIKDQVLWPALRPDLFSGRSPLPRSLLLFGPRGTGRSLLARCMAQQLGAVFLRLNGAALVTKWLGEGDQILQASFLVARCRQPAVVFISEVDLLLCGPRPDDGSPGRLQSELLLQLDGVLSSPADRVLVVCSSNKPEQIPESLRRYFTRRLLVPLPDSAARHQIIGQLLAPHGYCLSEEERALLVQRTEGFSGQDVAQLGQEAVLGCLHGLPASDASTLHPGQMRPVSYQDFDNVFCKFQPSVSQKDLDKYTEWNKAFGCSQ